MSASFQVAGLVSGMQWTSMIDQMMSIEQQPLQNMQQQESQIKAKQAAWQDLASKMQALQTALSPLLLQSTLSGQMVSFDTATPPLSATASTSAVSGAYSVLIQQLATGTVARSTGPIGAEIVSSDKLDQINFPVAVTAGTFSINGVSISVDPVNDSLDDVINRINASGAGVTAAIVQVNGRDRLVLTANSAGGPVQIGSSGDTSNFLSATSLLAAPRVGDAVTGTDNLGVADVNAALQSARLATPVSGTGALTINNVQISYDASTDSIASVINRINSSSANVIASYDPTTDRLRITNKQTGSVAIAMSDTGSFLSGMGLTGSGAQSLGQNAIYSLDGGTTLRYSASNTVTDAIPGVTMNFTATSATPVQLTVGPDLDSAVNAIKQFVDQYNAVLNAVRADTAYNATTKQGAILMGDSSALSLQSQLRDMMVSPATGMTGPYQLLGQIGISFGAWGSAVGSTSNLQVDETKLRAALQSNPQAVYQLFAGVPSATLSTAGDVASVSGTPTNLPSSGRYDITSDGAGNLTATFYDANGVAQSTVSGTITPGGTNTTLIPGVTLRAAATLTGASSSVAVSNQHGVMAQFNDFVTQVLGPDGVFKIRDTGADDEIKRLDDQMQQLQDRLQETRDRLVQQFTAMEQALATMQAQSAALTSQLAGLTGGTQSSQRQG